MAARQKPHKFGWGWRTKNGTTQTKVDLKFGTEDTRWADIPDTLDDLTKAVHDLVAEHGLEDWKIGMETVYGSYGDRDYDRFTVSGWRVATDEEVAEKQAEFDRNAEAQKVYLDNAERALREQRPELFKGGA